MPYTVAFDPTVGSIQAQIITDATPFADGVMTKVQAALLASLIPIVPIVGSVQTTNAVPTNIAVPIPIPLNQGVLIEVRVAGTRDDVSDVGGYVALATFRNQAGVVSLVGSIVDDFVAEDNPAWTGPDFVIVGTNVQMTVTGVAATIINWTISIETQAA
jgi:hypothetical protein